MSNIIAFPAGSRSAAGLPPGNVAEIKPLPYSVTRRIHSRKPRRSKNGTPEERAAKATPAEQPQTADLVAPYSGNPIRMTARGGDNVYIRIAEHREAVTIYDRYVDAVNDAEGKIPAGDFARLEAATAQAFDQMEFAARCLIIDVPTTRTGLARWAVYLRKVLNDGDDLGGGSVYLPEKINGKPWIDTLLRALSTRLRGMGDEFPADKRKAKRQAGTNFDQFIEHLRGYLNCKVLEDGKTIDQAIDDLKGGTLASLKTTRPQQ